jgi:hypothetical protein
MNAFYHRPAIPPTPAAQARPRSAADARRTGDARPFCAPQILPVVNARDPLRRVLEAADAVDRAVDARAPREEVERLRLALDLSFAEVLDALHHERDREYRAALVQQFTRLTESLDAFERRLTEPA